MAGILDWITEKAKAQYAKGAPYREAVGGLLQGDMNKVNQALSKSELTPMDFATTFAPIGITAWHGSPANFQKFDLSKIGTGEGAQNYGYGLYFSESPDIASKFKIPSKGIERNAFEEISKYGTPEKAIEELSKKEPLTELGKKHNKDLIDFINSNKLTSGNLYKVDIADEAIPKMMNWDKYISEQPQTMKKLQSTGIIDEGFMKAYGGKGGYGENVWKSAVGKYGSPQKAAEELNKLGVSGITYAEQGYGPKNYVVFDPNTIKILERNGLLLP